MMHGKNDPLNNMHTSVDIRVTTFCNQNQTSSTLQNFIRCFQFVAVSSTSMHITNPASSLQLHKQSYMSSLLHESQKL